MQTKRTRSLLLAGAFLTATVLLPVGPAAGSSDLEFGYAVGLSAYGVRVTEQRISLARESGLESFVIENKKCFAKEFSEIRQLILKRVAMRQTANVAKEPSATPSISVRQSPITFRMAERKEAIEPGTAFGRFLRELLRIVETGEARMKWKCSK